ncbi:MAG: hypothetical protein KGJ02_08625 [Verrucomicrobiota bacterium]|nr:hypothetical protein [Verrucomicrobiota bacterium]
MARQASGWRYPPYSLDLSDLKDKLLWLRTHDDEARQIAEAGRLFAEKYLTNEALVVYFYRLLWAYAAKISYCASLRLSFIFGSRKPLTPPSPSW